MALIVCPECNKEVSDKAPNCVHCGYPISKYKIQNYKIGHTTYDLSFVLDDQISTRDKIFKVHQLANIEIKESMYLVGDIYSEYGIPDSITTKADVIENNCHMPHCPTCGSSNLSKVSTLSKIMDSAVWGFGGRQRYKTYHCNNCGYEW